MFQQESKLFFPAGFQYLQFLQKQSKKARLFFNICSTLSRGICWKIPAFWKAAKAMIHNTNYFSINNLNKFRNLLTVKVPLNVPLMCCPQDQHWHWATASTHSAFRLHERRRVLISVFTYHVRAEENSPLLPHLTRTQVFTTETYQISALLRSSVNKDSVSPWTCVCVYLQKAEFPQKKVSDSMLVSFWPNAKVFRRI